MIKYDKSSLYPAITVVVTENHLLCDYVGLFTNADSTNK
jgi:hypothetical protein